MHSLCFRIKQENDARVEAEVLFCDVILFVLIPFLPGQSESVRDVQFSMKDYFTFAASFENGNVQLWDIRRPDRYERMFTAHTGPVFCCDWHPDDR